MARIALYLRMSKDREGKEIGVDRQEALCRKHLVGPDDEVVGVFKDNDTSASSHSRKRRKDYERMLKLGRAGGYDVIGSYSFKRLTRKYNEGGALLDLAEASRIGYRFVRGAPVDLNSAAGRKAFRAMINDAIAESEEISERVIDKFAEKLAAGEDHGGPRLFGYERLDGLLTINPVEAKAVQKAAADVLAGVSLSSIARRWNDAGLRPPIAEKFSPVTVRGVLRRPATAGILMHKGEPIGQGNWEPLLDEPTWRALCVLLDDKGRQSHNGTSPRWLGSSLYLCGRCDDGTTMRSNKNGGQPSYRCRRAEGHLTIKAAPVDEFVREVVAGRLRKRGADLLAKDRSEELAAASIELSAARAEHEALADSGISVALAAKKEPAILARIDAALDAVAQLGAGNVLSGVADAPDPGAAFLGLGVERQRAVIGAVAVITILPGRQVAHERVAVDWL